MKKKILSIAGVAVFAGAMAFNINASLSKNMDLTMANVEALAQGEVSIGQYGCRHTENCICIFYDSNGKEEHRVAGVVVTWGGGEVLD